MITLSNTAGACLAIALGLGSYSAQADELCSEPCVPVESPQGSDTDISGATSVATPGYFYPMINIASPTNGWTYLAIAGGSRTFTLPVFSDAQVSSGPPSTGWVFEAGADDLFGLGPGGGYMKWTFVGEPFNQVTPGMVTISFGSPFAPALWTGQVRLEGDLGYSTTSYIPLSPMAEMAGFTIDPAAVPEPITGVSLLVGLTAVAGVYRRRTHQRLAFAQA